MTNAEARVLSAVLQDKQVHVLLQANARQLFKTHADIYDFIVDYYEHNGVVPPAALVAGSFHDFEYDEAVGATKHHLEELRTDFLNSSMYSALCSAAALLQEKGPREAMSELSSSIGNITRLTTAVKDVDVTNYDDAIAHFELMHSLIESNAYGIRTGIKGFDDYMPAGIAPGQFGIILAFPAIGKSWLMLYLAVQAWLHGKVPLIISLEMSEAEVRNRILTILGKGLWTHRDLSAGNVDKNDFRQWASKQFDGKHPFHIISNENLGEVTPAVLRGKVAQYKPDIVFVDYVQLMQSNEPSNNETVKIKSISRDLKLAAGADKIPIVIIASATPDDNVDLSEPPTMDQVAWSKQLMYDTDWIVALGRAANSDVITVVARKNRNGPLFEFMLMTDFNRGLFKYKEIE